jgi:hypothetical protein
MKTVTSFTLGEAVRGLAQLRDGLSVIERATGRRRTPGRIAECEKIVDSLSSRQAGQLNYAAEAGVPLNDVWNAANDQIYDLLRSWEANDQKRINLMQ